MGNSHSVVMSSEVEERGVAVELEDLSIKGSELRMLCINTVKNGDNLEEALINFTKTYGNKAYDIFRKQIEKVLQECRGHVWTFIRDNVGKEETFLKSFLKVEFAFIKKGYIQNKVRKKILEEYLKDPPKLYI